MTPETLVRRQVCAWLTARGYLVFLHDSVGIFDPVKRSYRANRDPYRRKGVSDILGLTKSGKLLAVEVKANKGRPSPEQKQFVADVRARGGFACIAWSVEEVKTALEEFERHEKGEAK